jgi:hypothetical protein
LTSFNIHITARGYPVATEIGCPLAHFYPHIFKKTPFFFSRGLFTLRFSENLELEFTSETNREKIVQKVVADKLELHKICELKDQSAVEYSP